MQSNVILRKAATTGALIVLLATAACSGMSDTEQRVLSAGAAGAAGGAVLGAIVGGSPALGAVIGGAAGTAAGYLYDQDKKKKDRR